MGENPSGGDDQQGRLPRELTPEFIAGFVDGEGCFSVSIRPHPTVRYGNRFVITPVFQVYQHRDDVELLARLQRFFGCGSITSKGPKSSVMTYAVYGKRDLLERIIPFFDAHPLATTKQLDFEKFRAIVKGMAAKEHRTETGFRQIVEAAFSMNKRGKQRKYSLEQVLGEPSETVRQAPDDKIR